MPQLSDTMEEGTVTTWHKKVGDKVEAGETLLTLHANTENVDNVIQLIKENILISDKAVKEPKLIYEMITE